MHEYLLALWRNKPQCILSNKHGRTACWSSAEWSRFLANRRTYTSQNAPSDSWTHGEHFYRGAEWKFVFISEILRVKYFHISVIEQDGGGASEPGRQEQHRRSPPALTRTGTPSLSGLTCRVSFALTNKDDRSSPSRGTLTRTGSPVSRVLQWSLTAPVQGAVPASSSFYPTRSYSD